MSARAMTGTEVGRFSPMASPNQPLTLDVQPESGEERMWYALGYDGAQTFEAVPIQFRSFYDVGAADKKANRSPRATWVQTKAVLEPSPAADSSDAVGPPVPPAAVAVPPTTATAPVWPLVLGGAAATLGITLVLAARRKRKRNV